MRCLTRRWIDTDAGPCGPGRADWESYLSLSLPPSLSPSLSLSLSLSLSSLSLALPRESAAVRVRPRPYPNSVPPPSRPDSIRCRIVRTIAVPGRAFGRGRDMRISLCRKGPRWPYGRDSKRGVGRLGGAAGVIPSNTTAGSCICLTRTGFRHRQITSSLPPARRPARPTASSQAGP